MKEVSIGIVIPTFQRVHLLIRCLEKLPASGVEIVVSDDGNAEATRQYVEPMFPNVRVVQGPKRGPAANRNNGARHMNAELLIFLDDDCIPDDGLVEAYREAVAALPEVGIFEGRISPLGIPKGFACSVPDNETGGYLWSCNFAVRRKVFVKTGGFDERFPFAANEDMDLHLRLQKAGTCKFIRSARVFHYYETRSGPKPLRHKGLSSLLFLHLHEPNELGKRAIGFLKVAARIVLFDVPKRVRMGQLSHPFHLFRLVSYELKLSLVVLFWDERARLARLLYRPCCTGCKSIMEMLKDTTAVPRWPSVEPRHDEAT